MSLICSSRGIVVVLRSRMTADGYMHRCVVSNKKATCRFLGTGKEIYPLEQVCWL